MSKILKGIKKAEFCQMIIKSTATTFAMMINDKYRGNKFKFTPDAISNIAYTGGFFSTGYNDTDLINKYSGLCEIITVKEFWMEESRQYAKQLIDLSGLGEQCGRLETVDDNLGR